MAEPSSRSVSTYEAKTHLSQILADVETSRSHVTVTRHDKPIAIIVPVEPSRSRKPGRLKGQISMADDWDTFTDIDDKDWYGVDSAS